MKRILIYISITLFLFSCEGYPDPSTRPDESYSTYFQNSGGQRYFAGESSGEPVRYLVTGNYNPAASRCKVMFDLLSGAGDLSPDLAYTDENGVASTDWILGYGSCEQVLRASVWDPSGKFLTSTVLNAFGFRNNSWDAVSNQYDSFMWDLAADTANHLTFMVSNGGLYKQGENYFNWMFVPMSDQAGVNNIEVDSRGVFYISKQNGSVHKSTDHGITWTECTNPDPANSDFISLYVSNDDYLWVFHYGLWTKYSSDQGVTWHSAGEEFYNDGFQDLYRLQDGSILFHGSDCCSLKHSVDYGVTATAIETPGYSMSLYVDESDNIFIGTSYNGASIYKSTDHGGSFQQVYNSDSGYYSTGQGKTFLRMKDFYYVIVPGTGILKSSDLDHYELYWENQDLGNLFTDCSGVLIARSFVNSSIYYRHNPD